MRTIRTRLGRPVPRRSLILILVVSALSLTSAGPAMAYEPVNIVHTERVQAGPYGVTLGFSTWPLRAMQSLDFSFIPDGGIGGKNGELLMDGPSVERKDRVTPLARHPRKLDVWGLDVASLDTPGTYTFGFALDGPRGRGEGSLTTLTVLPQPGPPLSLSWALCAIPLIGLLALLVVAWQRNGPAKRELVL